MAQIDKVDVPSRRWDRVFAPSSCLVMITTVDAQGRVNAASYGSCVRISHEPVQIAFSPRNNNDTYRNLMETGEFVVNVPAFERSILEKVRVVGLPFARGVNELEKAKLTALPSKVVRPPRIQECKSHFECRVEWTREWMNRAMVVGQVVAVSVDADCLDSGGYVVWDRLRPAHYCGAPYDNVFVAAYQTMAVDTPYDGPERELFEKDRRAMLKE